jgi:hypothetical protein
LTIGVAVYTSRSEIGDVLFGMFFLHFGPVMTVVTSPTGRFAVVAICAISVGVLMVNWEAVILDGYAAP